jgi:uncharacterized MnhB-related membrane protein
MITSKLLELEDRSFEATLLFSVLGLVVSLLLIRLLSLDVAMQERVIGFLSTSIE